MKFCPQCSTSYEDTVGFCPRDGEVLEESPADMVGEVLDGQYEIEAFIARGGMGALYRARHIMLGDRVVIKTLRSEMRHNTEWLRRFQREGRAARRFRHPNSVTVYDLRTTPSGLIYMVMEYVDGQTLDKELKQHGRFSSREALTLLEPIASVLEAAHAQGVVHRDLKPENVMINRSADGHPTVKLLDLGIAKLRDVAETQTSGDAGGSLTMVGQILGTPYYMSPEQWGDLPNDGNPEIDGRADIYSLGVMFYELLTGTRPLTGTSLPELRAAHVNKILPPLHEVVPEVPEAYGQAVARAIAKDRADRPQTAGEMADAIRASLGLPPMSRATYSTSGASATNLEAGQPLPSAASSNGSGAASASVAPPAASIVSPAGRSSVPTNAPPENRRTMPTPDSSKTSAAIANSAAAPVYETHPPIVAPVDERKPARSVVPLIAGALAVLLLVVGVTVGGWLLWQRQRAKPEVTGTVVTEPGGGVGIKETVDVVEAVTFWIESFDKAGSKTGRRVAESGELRLASGQQFKFHFKPRERGYFYILGPGERNAPTTILTAQPVGILKTNQAVSDADFIFPYGTDALQLDRNPGTEEYTVVFSPTPLMSPAFLAAKAFHELTPAELKEWEDFRAQHKTAAPVLDVKESAADGGRAVSVSVPAAGDSGRPIFFDVRIAHQ